MTDGRRALQNPNLRFGQFVAAGTLVFLTLVRVMYPAPASILFLGAVLGALNALIAMGIVLVYRANRIINFAQGELGAIAGLLGVLLISSSHMPYVPAFALGLVAAIATGALVEFLFIRRLSRAPRLILTVATIGIAQLLAGGELALPSLFGTKLAPQDFPTPIHFTFTWDPVVFTGDHLIALGVVLAVCVGLGLFLRRTRYGMAIRATAESPERAAQLGIPVRHIGTAVWMLAAALSALASMLRAPIVGVPIGQVLGPALLLRALAAAVIGRMESLPVTIAAAIGLGMIEQAVFWSTGRTVLTDAVLFFVIVGALLLQRTRRVARGEAESFELVGGVRPIPRELRAFPEVRWGRFGVGALVALVLVVAPAFLDNGHVSLLGTGVILAIVGTSLVVLTGWAGEISLGQMAFFGFGAASAARLADLGWNILPVLLASALIGAVVAVLIGIPALRIRGPFLAVATFAFALATSSFFLNREYFKWFVVDSRVHRPTLFGVNLEAERSFYLLLLVVLALVLAAFSRFRRSRSGRVLVMTRDNPRAAQAFGVDVMRARLMAFALSGFGAALAGALFAYHQHVIGQSAFTPEESIRIFSLVVFGGLGSLPGVLAGAVWFTGIDFFVHLPQTRFLISGLGLLVVLLVVPGGLSQIVYGARDRFLRSVARRRNVRVPSLVADDAATPTNSCDDSSGSLPQINTRVAIDVRGLEVSYGHTQVLFGVDLSIAEGEVVALVGTNGAGKSTLLKAICGSVVPGAGTVAIFGDDVTGWRAEKAPRRGIALVPGGKGIFPTLTVTEHLTLAGWIHGRGDARTTAAVDKALDRFPVLRERAHQAAGTLSGGEQQMLTIACALVTEPTVLLIDELSLGLAPRVVDELLVAVKAVAAEGTTIVLVEQSINIALTVASRAVFMEKGAVRFDGPTAELLRRPELARAVFLGAATPARKRVGRAASPTETTQPALVARDLGVSFGGIQAVDGVSFSVAPGQILGIIGANGAGKTTTFDLLSGFLEPTRGEIELGGVDITYLSPDARARLGLGRSFQDARLFPSLTVTENIAGAFYRHGRGGVDARVAELIERFNLGDFADKFVSELSTGSRRIVDLACCVAHDPAVLLLDEPSSGIAQREAEALAPVLRTIRDTTGAALVIIEHDLPLLTDVSDQFVALELGRVIAHGTPQDVLNDPAVIASYLGDAGVAAKRSTSRKVPV